MEDSATKFVQSGDLSKVTTYQAGVMQATTHRTLQKLCDKFLVKYDLTKMQWLIVGTVLDAGPAGMRITDLAEKVGTNLSYLTNTINLLESKNILCRKDHTTDSRAKLVYVDSKFVPECQIIEDNLRKALRKSVYSKIKPKEFHIFMKVTYLLSEIKA